MSRPAEEVVVMGRFEIDLADMPQAIAHAQALARATHTEPGCIHYAFARDVGDDTVLWLSERWHSVDALQQHFAAPHFAAFASALRRLRVKSHWARRFGTRGEVDLLAPRTRSMQGDRADADR